MKICVMKRNFFLALALPLVMGSLDAQELLSDPGFDYWEARTGQNGVAYDDLLDPYWTTLNDLATLPAEMFTGPVTCFKESGRSGDAFDFAPRIVSSSMIFGGNSSKSDSSEIFLPGVIGTLYVDFAHITAVLGKPFSDRPDGLSGYLKYAPVNGDSATVFVELTRYTAGVGRQTVGQGQVMFHEAVEDWTFFTVPVEYRTGAQPDSITILIVGSAGYDFSNFLNCQGQKGSQMWVDDVQLYYGEAPEPDPSANENLALASSRLYPNPSADGRFSLQLAEACRVQVLSVTGQLLLDEEMTAGLQSLDLSKYAPAYYVVRLSNENGSAALKAVVR